MLYFKHECNDRNKPDGQLVLIKFGAQGYGVYTIIKEIVGEWVKSNNKEEWGEVDPMYDVELLAGQCHVTVDFLREFIKFCDDKKIFSKTNGRLYWKEILNRLDEYAMKLKRKKGKSPEDVPTPSRQSTDDVRQNRIEKNRIEKNNKENKKEKSFTPIEIYIAKFNELFQNNYQVTAGRKDKLKARLDTFKLEDILAAVQNLATSPFHRGKNDRGWKADPDFLIRNDEQIDKWLHYATNKLPVVSKPRIADMIPDNE